MDFGVKNGGFIGAKLLRASLLLVLVLVASSALAAKGEKLKEWKDKHTRYEVLSEDISVLKVSHKSKKEDKIKDLKPVIEHVLGHSVYYDMGKIKAKRKELLMNLVSESESLSVAESLASHNDNEVLEDYVRSRMSRYNESDYVDKDLLVVEDEDGTTLKKEGKFALKVFHRGNSFRLHKLEEDDDIKSNRKIDISDRDALKEARRLVKAYKLIGADQENQMVHAQTNYTHFTGKHSDPGDRVVSKTVYFARSIDDHPVLGFKSSEIAVELGRGGKVRYLFVDWAPVEKTTKKQKFVRADRLKKRVLGQLKKRAHIQTEGQYIPEVQDIVMDDMMCGYINLGAARGNASEMQIGCSFTLKVNGRQDPGLYMVPAAEEPNPQEYWEDTWDVETLENEGDNPEVDIELSTEF